MPTDLYITHVCVFVFCIIVFTFVFYHPRSGVMSSLLYAYVCVCTNVCNTVNFESFYMESSFFAIRYASREYDNLYSPVSIRTGSNEILTNLTKK